MDIEGKTAEGRGVEIEKNVIDAPAAEGYATVLKDLGVAEANAASTVVDGRPSRTLTVSQDGRQQTRTLVLADGALWIFTLDRAGGAAEDAAFQALLQSVDFDVR
jgi:hypothetical protein